MAEKSLNTFTIHETNEDVAKELRAIILSYKHLENMLNLIVLAEFKRVQSLPKEDRDYAMFNLLLNPVIMKAVIMECEGGDGTRNEIASVASFLAEDKMFEDIKVLKDNLNDKNVSMIVRRLKKDWDNFFKNNTEYAVAPSKFTGRPQHPKAKSLSKVYNYSVPVESSKFAMHKDGFRLTLGRFRRECFLRDNDYVTTKKITSMTVALSHGHIYYNFNFEVPETPLSNGKVVLKPTKVAGLDIGVMSLFALFVNDLTTKSLIYENSFLRNYNHQFNRTLKRLNKSLEKCVVEYRDVIKIIDDKEVIYKVPAKYNAEGRRIKQSISNMWNRRNLVMDSEMDKLSKKVLQYCQLFDVTDLVISSNLSMTKTDGSIKMASKRKQEFYQIPFGKLLNKIKAKSLNFGVIIKDINEAYTSKTSAISASVTDVQSKASEQSKVFQEAEKLAKEKAVAEGTEYIVKNFHSHISPDELNGVRGVKNGKGSKKGLSRGDFRDTKINKLLNADINGAANHIKVAFPDTDLSVFALKLFKFCNPVKIKSCYEFDRLIA